MGTLLANSDSVNINAAGHVDLQGCDRSIAWDGRGDGAHHGVYYFLGKKKVQCFCDAGL